MMDIDTFHRTDETARVLHEHGDCRDYCAVPAKKQRSAALEAALARHAQACQMAAHRAAGPELTFEHDAILHQRRAAELYAEARQMMEDN